MKKVTIVQRISAHYRIPFYKLLRKILLKRGVQLHVVFGQPSRCEKLEEFPNFHCCNNIKNHYFYIHDKFFVWQPILQIAMESDLLILQQASKILSNYPLIISRKILPCKLALWGHGQNFQASDRRSFTERVKGFCSTYVDFWFAYNDLSKSIIKAFGYPEEKIMSVNNAIDTKQIISISDKISLKEIQNLRERYHIIGGAPVAVFCSRLYKDKRINFLIRCVEKVRQEIPNFHVFIIGDGVEAASVRRYAEKHNDWFHWVGSKFGREKVLFFKLAQFQVMPGLVGLHIVESFALLTPLITTNYKYHSPEIDYLMSGENGIMSANNMQSYTEAIVRFISNPAQQKCLVEGCKAAREKYTIENMAARFADGVSQVLSI